MNKIFILLILSLFLVGCTVNTPEYVDCLKTNNSLIINETKSCENMNMKRPILNKRTGCYAYSKNLICGVYNIK